MIITFMIGNGFDVGLVCDQDLRISFPYIWQSSRQKKTILSNCQKKSETITIHGLILDCNIVPAQP